MRFVSSTSSFALALALATFAQADDTKVAQYYSDKFSVDMPSYNLSTVDEDIDATGGDGGGNPVDGQRPWSLIVGGAMVSSPEFMGASDSDVLVLPYVDGSYRFENGITAFAGPMKGIGAEYGVAKGIDVGLKVDFRGDRESSDDAILRGMPDVDTAFEAGPFVRLEAGRLTFEALVLADLSNTHDGTAVEAGVDYNLPLPEALGKKWLAGVGFGTLWGDSNFNDTYFGVRAAQALATRPAYTAGSGFVNYNAGANLMYLFDRNWFARGDVRVERLVGDAEDSPITREDTSVTGVLSVGYRF
jgi:outer membrane protein